MFKPPSILVLALAFGSSGLAQARTSITTFPSAISNWWKAACRKVPKLTVAGNSTSASKRWLPYPV